MPKHHDLLAINHGSCTKMKITREKVCTSAREEGKRGKRKERGRGGEWRKRRRVGGLDGGKGGAGAAKGGGEEKGEKKKRWGGFSLSLSVTPVPWRSPSECHDVEQGITMALGTCEAHHVCTQLSDSESPALQRCSPKSGQNTEKVRERERESWGEITGIAGEASRAQLGLRGTLKCMRHDFSLR